MSHAVKPKSQLLKQPIRQKGNVKSSQWQLKVKTGKLPKARENEGDQATIRFSFEYDWLRKRREISEPITRRIKAKEKQSFYYWHSIENNQKKQKVAPGNKLTKGGTMT